MFKRADKTPKMRSLWHCFTLIIVFNGSPTLVAKANGKIRSLNQDESEKAVADVQQTRK